MKFLFILISLMSSLCFATDTIILTSRNTISLRDTVNWSSVGKLQLDLLNLSHSLEKDEIIYLVLDTPGGSVAAGELFIEVINGITQPVHSIVIYAASMGFQINQASSRRLILSSGTLMSHRAVVSVKGQIGGEVETKVAYYKMLIGVMEKRSSSRVGISLDEYRSKIANEWWEVGKNAVEAKVSDEVVKVSCDSDLTKKTVNISVRSQFGSRTLTFSACPLITTPLAPLNNESFDTDSPMDMYLNLLFFDKRTFVNRYINTGIFNR